MPTCLTEKGDTSAHRVSEPQPSRATYVCETEGYQREPRPIPLHNSLFLHVVCVMQDKFPIAGMQSMTTPLQVRFALCTHVLIHVRAKKLTPTVPPAQHKKNAHPTSAQTNLTPLLNPFPNGSCSLQTCTDPVMRDKYTGMSVTCVASKPVE
jgi:hypothetical protein